MKKMLKRTANIGLHNGITGDLSGITGNLSDCDISDEERARGIDISELIGG